MVEASQSDTDELFLVVRVTTADGAVTGHMYPLEDAESAQIESQIGLIQQDLEDSFAGREALLALAHPVVMYRPDYVVRVSFEVMASEQPTSESEDRGAIGFRTP